jgi:hypothetical protein
MLGNWATGRLRIVSEPTGTRTMEMTMATIGRLMKNFDMASPARRFSNKRPGIYFGAGAHLLHALRHQAFACLRPSAMIHWLPTCSPTLTVRIFTLLSASTTATW